jgi:transposase-like protein
MPSTKPANWRKLQRHPDSAEYPDIGGRTFDRMVDRIKRFGVFGRKIKLLDGKVWDGWQLYRACLEAGVEPPFEKLRLPGGMSREEALEIVQDLRRHETQDQAERRAEERRQRVAEAVRNGQSVRSVAKAEGVTHKTIQKDLAKVGNGDGSPKKTKPLCDRCARLAAPNGINGCPMCAELRQKPKGDKPKPEANGHVDDGPTDHFGNVLPKRCRDAFCDPWAQEAFDLLARVSEEVRKARLADGMKKRAKDLPWFRADDVIEGVRAVVNYLDKLVEHFRTQRPAGVCPACDGEGCTECLRSGLVTRDDYKRLSKK